MTNRKLLLVSLLMASCPALAVEDITVGDVVVDEPTLCCLGFSLPVSGDDDYDAVATIEYRPAGTATWRQALPMLRVRPELTSDESPPGQYGLPVPAEQFAGSVFGLDAGTNYEIRLSVTDPDGGNRTQTVQAATRNPPRDDPQVPRIVSVSTMSELSTAVTNSQAGDVIQLAPGTYVGTVTVNNNGTATNPIVLRGASAETVTIDASGWSWGVSLFGRHVYVEHLTVTGASDAETLTVSLWSAVQRADAPAHYELDVA